MPVFGVQDKGTIHATWQGAPQGGPLSPLLGNILLDKLDKALESRGLRFCRYADDIRIFVKSGGEAQREMRRAACFIERRLKLKVNGKKSKVTDSSGNAFLGFTMKGGKIRWTEDSYSRFVHSLKKLTGRSNGMSLLNRINRINIYVRGWMNYYGISQYYRPIQDFDGWLRRRIRMCQWKQWRYVRTRVRNLRALGVPLKMSIGVGRSSKSFWHLSRTYATNFGMSNEWFNRLGLVSVKTLWCRAQGYIE